MIFSPVPALLAASVLFFAMRGYAAGPRIISLAPNTTEILFELGLGDSVVGVDEYSNFPPAARGITRVGTFAAPEIEKIILLQPDYIFLNTELESDLKAYLASCGVRIIKVQPHSVMELLRDIRRIGDMFGREKEADRILRDFHSRISRLMRTAGKERHPRVFLELFGDPLVTASSFLSDVIEIAGGENIAPEVKSEAGIFSLEELIYRDPDVIIVTNFSGKGQLPESLKAVRRGRVYNVVNPDILLRPGPRIIDAIEELNRLFYRSEAACGR